MRRSRQSRGARIVVTLVILHGAAGCKGEGSGDAAAPEAEVVTAPLSEAGFKQAPLEPDEAEVEGPASKELPPERLWSPKDLGFGKKSSKKGCFPSTEKDYAQVVGRAGDIEVLVQDFTAIFHPYTLDATKKIQDTLENRKDLVHELIDQELLALAAKRKGYESTQVGDLMRKRELADMIRADMKEQARSEQSEEAYKKFYKQNPKKYMIHPDQRKVVLIVIKGKKTAQKIIDTVRAEKTTVQDFVKQAKAVSLAPDAKTTSGKTDWFDREGMGEKARVVPEVVGQAAFKLKKEGDIYPQPLSSSSGWHVIMLLKSRDEKWIPFSKVRASIAAKFVSERQKMLVENLLDALKKNHPVSVNLSTLEKISPVPCM